MSMRYDLKEGECTSQIYTLIKDGKHRDAIDILSFQLSIHTKSRAALSLLGHCYYYIQDFVSAADCYEQLTVLYPEQDHYKLYYAQCLFKCGFDVEAMKACGQIDNPSYYGQVTKLQSAIQYEKDELKASLGYIEKCPQDDADCEINRACILYKEGKYEEALEKYNKALQILGFAPNLSYNIGICYYQLKHYDTALKNIADIIEKGIKEHPELSVGMQTDGIEVASVGNTVVLHESCLIEAFNLKSAIQFNLKNLNAAREALTDMPPRSEHEIDSITLHNMAIMNMDEDPSGGFEKLQFLIQRERFPQETFANLCILYIKYEYFDLAADVLAQNAHLTYRYLTPYEYDFLEAKITQQTSPEEAYRKFEELGVKQIENLRKLTKEVQEIRKSHRDDLVKRALNKYDDALEKYIPILMAQASIYWKMEHYSAIEKIFRKSVEFCSDHDSWRLNVAHVLFMQDNNKYKDAIGFYEPIVKKHYDNILHVSPIVLANLCVTYIMTSQNEEAEELMRKIEREEEQVAYENPEKKIFHLCIVNLVIGTLYCAKGNYEFGITRVMKSLEPYSKKLGTDTWFYTKRCFLALFENMAKHLILLRDSVIAEIIQFLTHCETYGKDVKANIESPLEQRPLHVGRNTVAYEARLLKWLIFELIEY